MSRNGDSRWLAVYDSYPEPSVSECEVVLKKNEIIRPDATRLIRTRPGWSGNANATREGVPGFALNWLELEGPLQDEWPPASFKAVAGDMPFKLECGVKLVAEDATRVARKLLIDFKILVAHQICCRHPRRGCEDGCPDEAHSRAETAGQTLFDRWRDVR